ncbi:MAG: uroporphyrinogen decarboxylase family protein [Lentisphaeria bacterium]|jgi:uroporphyrinogen decarboxylase|nr:uroporphyrinogen decarboxylase family protein [Lentisphaeria bacterium]MDP7741322.1 uroporphyrinogen decarboxylase family protein [Lentisphaeria bacterium]
MTTRELWQDIMYYKGHDRMPVTHWDCWDEARDRWVEEGMPETPKIELEFYQHPVPICQEYSYFNADPRWARVAIELELYPPFEEEIVEETDEYCIKRGPDGALQQRWKHKTGVPHHLDFALRGAAEWEAFKERLQPDPGRIPDHLDKQIAEAESSGLPIIISIASMMGWIRNWMGVENMSYLMHDRRDIYADMVQTLADLTCWAIDVIIPRMNITPDMGYGWEDICGKSGPLLSPQVFKQCVTPGYTKIREKLESYGVKLLGIDSDGDVDPLAAAWLDAGVNVLFPLEIGTWNADPMVFRKKYGRELRIIGGLNKHALEEGREAIDAEIERRVPLMRDGGFIVLPDHYITPATSLADYKYYLDRIRTLRL